MLSQEYCPMTNFRPFSPNFLHNSSLLMRKAIFPAKSFGLSTSVNSPFSPLVAFVPIRRFVLYSLRKSGMPPTLVPITGKPAAIASKNELPSPSDRDGRTKTSARARCAGIFSGSTWPRNSILFSTPKSFANRLSFRSSGPLPRI